MNAQDSKREIFDVFLCHNSEDKPTIREISQKLASKNIKPWLDEEQIRPGTSWQTALGQHIESIRSAAVFVGESGLGPWQNQEIQALLSQFVKRECPVIPVVLPSAKTTPNLPWTLANLHYVDFRATNVDPLQQLIWGITGVKPSDQSHVSSAPDQVASLEADVKELLPRKDKVVIELRLPGNFNEFSDEKQARLFFALNSLLDVGEVRLLRAVAGSVRLHLALTPEDADKIYAASQKGQLATLGIAEARLYPAIAVPPDEEQRSQLLVLLDRVNETWVEGVLKNSLFNEALISLGKRPMSEAIEPPWKSVVAVSSQRSQLILKDRNITTLFDATGLLLILGEPGSGKTTTLLELAAHLISRAKADAKERVPLVLNLSSWKKKQPLLEWMAGELSQRYQVPVKLARAWLEKDYLVPLLDGLDEVPTALQPDCVAAINDFIDDSEPSGLVVCCRLMEYQWLPKRLKLNGAICLESLSPEEVSKYLESGGPKLTALREAVNSDPLLQELAQTPLMLSIMSLAFQGVGGEELAGQKGNSLEERRKQIFGLYVEQMFRRKGTIRHAFAKDKTIGWLSSLAEKMREQSQSVFLVEGLQPSWLGTKGKRVAYGTIVALSLGLIFALLFALIVGLTAVLPGGVPGGLMLGLILGLKVGLYFGLITGVGVGLGCWSESPSRNGLISGSIGSLIVALIGGLMWQRKLADMRTLSVLILGLMLFGSITGAMGGLGVGSLNHITLVESMSWKWNQFWKRVIPGLIFGLIIGLIVGLIILFNSEVEEVWRIDILFGIICGLLIFALIFALIFGLVTGLFGGFTDRSAVGKATPNQGIKLSLKNSLTVFLITELIGGLIGGLAGWLTGGLTLGLTLGLIAGLIAGLIGGFNRGGSAVMKHYALRLILWLTRYTPLNFIKFLDYCARLILLKKVGGGYIFIHRMLLEYFAELTAHSKRLEVGSKASK